MKRFLLSLFFGLALINNVFATPNNTMSITPSATDATTITASDENTRNSAISTAYNAHSHTDISQTANTLNVGDAAAGNKTITAYNADANKPFLRYDDTANNWIVSTDGANSNVVLSGSQIVFEGGTANDYETTVDITEPTVDRVQTLQNNTGIIPLSTAGNTCFFTTTGATSLTLPTSGTLLTSGKYKVLQFTRAMDGGTADVAYTGVGFTPTQVIVLGGIDAGSIFGFGFGNVTTAGYGADANGITTDTWNIDNIPAVIRLIEATGKNQTAAVKSFDADGFTLTWTRTGVTAAGTAQIWVLCLG